MDYQSQYPPHYQHPPHLYPPQSQQQQQNPSITPNPTISSFNQHPPPPQYAVVSAPPFSYSFTPDAHQNAAYNGHYDVTISGVHSYYQLPQPQPAPLLYPNPNDNFIHPNGTQQLITANFDPNLGSKRAVWCQGNNGFRKRVKKVQVPLSVRCDVCKIVCDTQDVLDKHRTGRKHKKNLEKLKAVVAGVSTTPVVSTNSVASLQEAQDPSRSVCEQPCKNKDPPHSKDLDTKRRNIVNSGTAINAIRACSICKVVCNSETVFQSHLAGQKHATMVKKQASVTKLASAPRKSF